MGQEAFRIKSVPKDFLQNIVQQPLYFVDSGKAAARGLFISVLAGFKWFLPKELSIINFDYSTYTYYGEEISNSIVEKQSSITLEAQRECSFINTYATNIITNNMMINALKEYSKDGGLFMLLTPIGIIKDLALENVYITFRQGNPQPIFNFKFRKLIISSTSIYKLDLQPRYKFCL